MSDNFYLKLNRYMLSHKKLSKTLVILCKAITLAFYIFYPLFLALCFYIFGMSAIKLALIPFISLIIVSVIRALINSKRPYEQLPITPLYNKKTAGKSFPSRHTFAVFIITFSLYFFCSPISFSFLLFLSVALAILRVLLGVHYISDVLAGFLFAVFFAVLGYKII